MKFATLGHLVDEKQIQSVPKQWLRENIIVSPEMNINGARGNLLMLKISPQEIMTMPRDEVRQKILEAALFAQNVLDIDVLQLGALTTSVTSGGRWLTDQKEYTGFVNHGDSYTAAVTCQAVFKALNFFEKKPSELVLAVVGAYGIIGEAVSKMLVPKFTHSILIGPRKEKLNELETKIRGSYETTVDMKTKDANVIITATNHPTALLTPSHLKKNAIIVDVSQPQNLSPEVCKKRADIVRVDGGFVDFPPEQNLQLLGMPKGKNFACIVEIIMQALEKEPRNHVGSIDLEHLKKTEKWAEKYGFTLNQLTNFGMPLKRQQ